MVGDDSHEPDPDLDNGQELIHLGADSLGAIIGAGVGLVFGPPGALAGAAAGPSVTRVLRWAGGEIKKRMLSSKEEARIGTALLVAIGRIEERKAAGEHVRADGLIDPGEDPEGLLEGTLLTAARSYDQKKVPFTGAFYASFAFETAVAPGTAHYLLRLIDRLTYRQLCALAYIADADRQNERELLQARAEEEGLRTSPTLSAELNDLANEGLIGYLQDDGSVVNPLAILSAGTVTAGSMARAAPTELGTTLVRMGELQRIPAGDLEAIGAALRGEAD